MPYTDEDYHYDLISPEMLHIQDKKRFVAFYERLGKDDIQKKQQVVETNLDVLEKVKGSVIELGCHVGFQSIFLAARGHTVTGVDISSTLLDEANFRKNQLPGKVREKLTFIHSDIMDLNGVGKFDTVLLTEVLEHVIDPFKILEKSIEFMYPDSILLISAPNKRRGTYSHVRGISEQWLIEKGKDVGIHFTFFSTKKQTKAIGKL